MNFGLLSRLFIGLSFCGVLASCTSGSKSALDTIKLAMSGDQSGATHEPQNPAFKYLRVTAYGRTAFLVMGYVDGANQTWYSAKGEMLKVNEGRLVGAAGLETEWRQVQFASLPTWSSVVNNSHLGTWSFQRTLDVMPGYKSGVMQRLRLKSVSFQEVQGVLGKQVLPWAAKPQLLWFQEASDSELPHSYYAVDAAKASPEVVFTYQCLSAKLCMSLEPWEPKPVSKAKTSKP
jgi:hypothetical protein